MPNYSFSKSEEKMMDFLWRQDKPLSVWEISELWDDKTWTDHYLRYLLKGLEKKGAVECCGAQQRDRQYSRRFRCLISREEYYSHVVRKSGLSLNELIHAEAAALTKKGRKEDMAELIQSLEEIIGEFKDRIEGEE